MYSKKVIHNSTNINSVLLCLFLVALLATPADSESSSPISYERAKIFERVNEAYDDEDYSVALGLLAEIQMGNDLTAVERAYVANFAGHISVKLGDLHIARIEFQKILDLEANLPKGFVDQVMYVLAQTEFNSENYFDAINHLNEYLDSTEKNKHKAYALLAQANYMVGEYCDANKYVTLALENESEIDKSTAEKLPVLLRHVEQRAGSALLENCPEHP